MEHPEILFNHEEMYKTTIKLKTQEYFFLGKKLHSSAFTYLPFMHKTE